MFRLTVIAGPPHAQPARGSTFAVGTGSFSIGRHSGNAIVLHSGNVSKKHCVLVVNNTGVAMEDQGSSNGTFVNGRLATKKNLNTGDRISVGEFVLELSDQSLMVPANPSNVLPFPSQGGATGVYSHGGAPMEPSETEEEPMPKDLIGKFKFHFDRYVLPYFLGFNERFEWRVVIGSLFGVYLALNLFISLSPLMEQQEKAVEHEIKNRAQAMAHEIADRNSGAIAAKADSKLDLGSFDKAWGVKNVVIIDMDGKILAPASKAGRYFEGSEATAAIKVRKLYNGAIEEKQVGVAVKSDEETIAWIEPIKVLNAAKGKNETAAMAIVSIDSTTAVAEGSELWLVYSHTLVLSILIGIFIFYLIYRITIRPFQEMNRKIDQVLRGEAVEFKSPVYFSEVDSLWNVIDSALKRVPRAQDGNQTGQAGGVGALTANDLLPPLRAMGHSSKNGIAVLDEERRVLFINSVFEEITGVRQESSEGQPLSNVVRDQAFSGIVTDLCERASPGTDGISEDIEFSGISFQLQVVSFGHFGDPKCFVFTLIRKEE